ncbi:heparinase, partial [Fertoebacter nigrum]|nr:heparinase [Fertoeibacter niger]
MTGFAARKTRLLNRWEARRAGIARPMTAFDRPPEPRTIGLFARGKQLVAGHVLLAGQMIETRGETLWAVAPPGSAFGVEAQGFAWLDDLAALGDSAARICAQTWTWDWIARYGAGRGPGWTPDLAGRRVIRWINHATLLLTAKDAAAEEVFLRALAR